MIKLEGSGAVAIGDRSKAIGEAGLLVEGGVGGDALAAGAVKVEIQTGPVGTDPAALRAAYLNRVLEMAAHLSLAGIDPKAASEAEARLNTKCCLYSIAYHCSGCCSRFG